LSAGDGRVRPWNHLDPAGCQSELQPHDPRTKEGPGGTRSRSPRRRSCWSRSLCGPGLVQRAKRLHPPRQRGRYSARAASMMTLPKLAAELL